MEDLYYKKRGKDPDFVCATVRLNLKDLDALESELNEWLAYGPDSVTRQQIHFTKEFIERARSAIQEGKVVLYARYW